MPATTRAWIISRFELGEDVEHAAHGSALLAEFFDGPA
jgi:hypothetical protein